MPLTADSVPLWMLHVLVRIGGWHPHVSVTNAVHYTGRIQHAGWQHTSIPQRVDSIHLTCTASTGCYTRCSTYRKWLKHVHICLHRRLLAYCKEDFRVLRIRVLHFILTQLWPDNHWVMLSYQTTCQWVLQAKWDKCNSVQFRSITITGNIGTVLSGVTVL